MSIFSFTLSRPSAPAGRGLSPSVARGLYALPIVVAAVAGVLATDPGTALAASTQAGADLTRLLRLMALIKAAMAAAAFAAVWWRLGLAVSAVRFAIYAVAGTAMVAGPGLIWCMAHVGLGALLLHAGLATTLVLLWRDPAVGRALDAALQRRALRL